MTEKEMTDKIERLEEDLKTISDRLRRIENNQHHTHVPVVPYSPYIVPPHNPYIPPYIVTCIKA
jgi:hypothetical protein